jgi:hypothetical protein
VIFEGCGSGGGRGGGGYRFTYLGYFASFISSGSMTEKHTFFTVVGTSDIILIFRYFDTIGLSNSYRNIGLTYISDFNYRTSYIGHWNY